MTYERRKEFINEVLSLAEKYDLTVEETKDATNAIPYVLDDIHKRTKIKTTDFNS